MPLKQKLKSRYHPRRSCSPYKRVLGHWPSSRGQLDRALIISGVKRSIVGKKRNHEPTCCFRSRIASSSPRIFEDLLMTSVTPRSDEYK